MFVSRLFSSGSAGEWVEAEDADSGFFARELFVTLC
jgi:hypothetical protein